MLFGDINPHRISELSSKNWALGSSVQIHDTETHNGAGLICVSKQKSLSGAIIRTKIGTK